MFNIYIKPEIEKSEISIRKDGVIIKYFPPIKSKDRATCYDVYAHWIKQKKDFIEIGLGFATEFSNVYKGCIVPRSGITDFKLVMENSPAQMESDFRGEWRVRFRVINRTFWDIIRGRYPNPYKVGDRVAQIFFDYENPVNFILTDKLSVSDRGTDGFNSTGLN
jgi:dUTPase